MSISRPVYLAAGLAVMSALLHVVAFPNFSVAEAAFVFALPLLFWCRRERSRREVLVTAWVAGFISWFLILIWLRHVTWIGTALLSGILACFWALWFWLVSLVYPKVKDGKAIPRLGAFIGLAGLWVVLEWVRSWLFTGFPWLPLAASMWNRPALLQILSVTGVSGLSFVLIFFNLAMSHYLPHVLFRPRKRPFWQGFCPEFYVAILLLGLTFSYSFASGMYRKAEETIFTAGFVQPYIPQDGKWDEAFARDILSILDRQSHFAREAGADVIFWPESATPYPILGEDYRFMARWTSRLANSVEVPLVQGNMAAMSEDRWYNMVNIVYPEAGVGEDFYAKRKLVPFGEYIPLQRLFPFIDPFIPFVGFSSGESPVVLPFEAAGRTFQVGPLVCYEDIFASLARDQAKAGADFLFVATNNAWYGEEAGAYQHAIHSVLRAVETRRPVLRSGNGGWSGWIDEYGIIRYVVEDEENGIYIRSTAATPIHRNLAFVNHTSTYLRLGDWFVLVSAISATGLLLFRRRRQDSIH